MTYPNQLECTKNMQFSNCLTKQHATHVTKNDILRICNFRQSNQWGAVLVHKLTTRQYQHA